MCSCMHLEQFERNGKQSSNSNNNYYMNACAWILTRYDCYINISTSVLYRQMHVSGFSAVADHCSTCALSNVRESRFSSTWPRTSPDVRTVWSPDAVVVEYPDWDQGGRTDLGRRRASWYALHVQASCTRHSGMESSSAAKHQTRHGSDWCSGHPECTVGPHHERLGDEIPPPKIERIPEWLVRKERNFLAYQRRSTDDWRLHGNADIRVHSWTLQPGRIHCNRDLWARTTYAQRG